MKIRPLSPPFSSRQGFTLVEVLAAVAVLSIIVVALAQVLAVVSTTWQQGVGRVNNFSKSRSVLDMVAADVSRGVFRPDLWNFPKLPAASGSNGTGFAFYTLITGPGTVGVERDASLVTYQLNLAGSIPYGAGQTQPGDLLRYVQSIPWTPPSGGSNLPTFQDTVSSAPANSSNKRNDVISSGILDFEVLFIRTDGSAQLASDYKPPTTYTPVTASSTPVVMMVIGIAAVDDQTLKALGATGLNNIYNTLSMASSSAFASQPKNMSSLKRVWDAQIPDILAGPPKVPKNMAIGMKTFERTVPCTPFN